MRKTNIVSLEKQLNVKDGGANSTSPIKTVKLDCNPFLCWKLDRLKRNMSEFGESMPNETKILMIEAIQQKVQNLESYFQLNQERACKNKQG